MQPPKGDVDHVFRPGALTVGFSLPGGWGQSKYGSTSCQVTGPLLLKIAPDLSWQELDAILEAAEACSISGIVAGNTTVSRVGLRGKRRSESGGLSGKPLSARSTEWSLPFGATFSYQLGGGSSLGVDLRYVVGVSSTLATVDARNRTFEVLGRWFMGR